MELCTLLQVDLVSVWVDKKNNRYKILYFSNLACGILIAPSLYPHIVRYTKLPRV